MTKIEGVLLWLSIAGYVLGLGAYWVGWLFKKEAGMDWGWRATLMAFLLQTVAMAARWLGVGHPPVMGTYENSLTGSWFLVILFFASSRWVKDLRPVGSIVLPVALLLLGNGINSGPALEPLAPPYQSNWLWVHVAFAWLAFGSFVLCALIGAIYLWRGRREVLSHSSLYQRLPSQDILDDLGLRVMAFGFLADTVMIASGSLWAHGLWGRYWAWDPIETWSLISWLIYGINLHLRLALGWKGPRAAWLATGSLAGVIITFFGVGFMTSIHTRLL